MRLRIALIGNAMNTMVRFRGPLILALGDLGHEVIAICPTGTNDETKALTALGARHVRLERMSRQGLDPRAELALLSDLTEILRDMAPDRVFSYFIKPAVWGSVAAKRAGVPRSVAMIEGMGYAFSAPPHGAAQRLKQATARHVILRLLKWSGRYMDHILVLNKDDAQMMRRNARIPENRLTVIDGIGIDLDHFAPAPPHLDPVRFLLAARLIREKGIDIFAACAARVKERYPDARFRLLGGVDSAPGALPEARIESWVHSGLLEWPGQVSDIRPHLRDSSVFVLPTLYREGLPRSTMEAMAMARPVITSDMPGAVGSICHGESGLIHPAGDLDKLVSACLRFCEKPDDIARMGKAAVEEARRRYNIDTQNKRQIDLIIGDKNPAEVNG